ncbi:histidine-rich glycoprotein-like [Toxorhynchites rutilus septentrionalis]|uniref:histidine-rich glycoprotein-like n=1 Tax=Toxorhynchites rutilus septentrionalis TaxID=329112 RepID=UPI00247A517A|nr:histidine-rich glycoprotein-like [Toxorhynchites rutilus septentrionalis]
MKTNVAIAVALAVIYCVSAKTVDKIEHRSSDAPELHDPHGYDNHIHHPVNYHYKIYHDEPKHSYLNESLHSESDHPKQGGKSQQEHIEAQVKPFHYHHNHWDSRQHQHDWKSHEEHPKIPSQNHQWSSHNVHHGWEPQKTADHYNNGHWSYVHHQQQQHQPQQPQRRPSLRDENRHNPVHYHLIQHNHQHDWESQKQGLDYAISHRLPFTLAVQRPVAHSAHMPHAEALRQRPPLHIEQHLDRPVTHPSEDSSEDRPFHSHIDVISSPKHYPEKPTPYHNIVHPVVEPSVEEPHHDDAKKPVYLEKHVPYRVDRPVPYPVRVPVEQAYKDINVIRVPKPVPVPIERPYPVYVHHPVYVNKPMPVRLLIVKEKQKSFWG